MRPVWLIFARYDAVCVRTSNRQMPLSTGRVSRLNLHWFNYILRRVQCFQHQIGCESSFVGESAIKISGANLNYARRSPTTFFSRLLLFAQINQLRTQLWLAVSQLAVSLVPSSGKSCPFNLTSMVSVRKAFWESFCLLNASPGIREMLITLLLRWISCPPRGCLVSQYNIKEITATSFHWTALTNDVLLAKRNKIFAR